ncbi:aspartate aminotransferase family protein [Frankia sp. AgB32]|uniref:pyridoxal phosphate-dependent decarboxylase family protein n=1 Tax=Frankia sp. AgB32 TaxID=631119 RepID=UPI00200D8B84|nr:pyridoxal-dependent decarboxylase [Frankia sp. AgB32]MCK9893072.1 pyridoxal-dependent decarboxylase [Frankia sp. AgB32]
MTRPVDHRSDLPELVGLTLAALTDGNRRRGGPLPRGGPSQVREAIRATLGASPDRASMLPQEGIGAPAALTALVSAFAAGSADPADPWCAAHLHCPPLAVAVAADLAVSALNPSLDSWDQAPAATTVETEVVAALAELAGLDPSRASGTITTGGSESNLLGLLLARDAANEPTIRVFRSAAAHLSIDRAATILGLASRPVVVIPTDDRDRMRVDLLGQALAAHDGPAVVVATAGTTDAGAIDPLPDLVAAVDDHRARLRHRRPPGGHRPESLGWLHVDAAYGGGALFSDRLAELLSGIAQADSVALDLHKLGWQPAAAGVFLTPRPDGWPSLRAAQADYLRSDDDEDAGFPSLLDRSPRTTRRADCFPIAVTLRALGRGGLGTRVDACHELARHAARTIRADHRLELAFPVTLSTVVFRYRPPSTAARSGEPPAPGRLDQLNAEIRRTLLVDGRAVVGRTRTGPDRAVQLKLTLLNPDATPAHVDALLALIAATGDELASRDHDLRDDDMDEHATDEGGVP